LSFFGPDSLSAWFDWYHDGVHLAGRIAKDSAFDLGVGDLEHMGRECDWHPQYAERSRCDEAYI
jgi:hypothetical protein